MLVGKVPAQQGAKCRVNREKCNVCDNGKVFAEITFCEIMKMLVTSGRIATTPDSCHLHCKEILDFQFGNATHVAVKGTLHNCSWLQLRQTRERQKGWCFFGISCTFRIVAIPPQ